MGPRKKKLPQNAFRYYAEMYHKRKHTIESRYSHPMDEVYKSWNSLSESERQQFYSQYNEYKIKYNQLLADRLKEAEPFMKKREPNRKVNPICKDSVAVITDEQSDMVVEAVTSQTEEANNSSPQIDQTESEDNNQLICDNDETPNTVNQTVVDGKVVQLNNTKQVEITRGEDHQTEHIISEPAPPTVKSGKELYCMLDKDKCTPWPLLPQSGKKQYSRAVFLLKKDYITKYKKYLESLTPRELFDYYNKKIF